MSAHADRNLLFGIIALQMDFINRDALLAGMSAWVLAKHRPLGDILIDHGGLRPEHRALLDPLVRAHLAHHANDPAQSLAAVSSVPPTLKQRLSKLSDDDLQASLAAVNGAPAADEDPYATRAAVGEPTSGGLRFRIMRPHAEGGLGRVYVALDSELHREVALKEIKDRFADHPESRARFVVEAEITGGLEHPGIVPVYGLGTYPDGRPFYAMRFIRGDSLKEAISRFHSGPTAEPSGPSGSENSTESSRSRHGTVKSNGRFDSVDFRQLLRRFVDVCNAVAYAHSRKVLHRDLKPANVMLGKYGETLVVDWGLAKPVGGDGRMPATSDELPLTPSSGSGSGETLPGQAVGTPEYMSPEQAAGRLDLLGPATDIYSLGATLFAVLTGGPPVAGENLAEILHNVERGAVLSARAVSPGVPAALAAVGAKAMALKPVDRYGSAQELAADVERWLADEPVTAFREPIPARARRWVRRHRAATAVTAALLVASTLFLTVMAFVQEASRRQLKAEQQNTEAQRRKAAANLDTALTAVDTMLTRVSDQLEHVSGFDTERRAILEQARGLYRAVLDENATDPRARFETGRAFARLGEIDHLLGQAREGEQNYDRATKLLTDLVNDYPDNREYRAALGKAENDWGLMYFSSPPNPANALRLFEAAVGVLAKMYDEDPSSNMVLAEYAKALYRAACVNRGMKRSAEAETQFRKSLDLQAELVHRNPTSDEHIAELGSIKHSAAYFYQISDRPREAEALLRQAAPLFERLAVAHPTVVNYQYERAFGLDTLAALFMESGRTAEAEATFNRSQSFLSDLAAAHPSIPRYRELLASSFSDRGQLYQNAGRLDDAELYHRRSAAIWDELTARYPDLVETAENAAEANARLAELLRMTGRAAESLSWYEKSIPRLEERYRRTAELPGTAQTLATAYAGRAAALTTMGRSAEALAGWDKALATLPKGDPAEPVLRLGRLAAVVRRDGPDQAVAEAEGIIVAQAENAAACHAMARVFAAAAAAAPNRDYADRAMAFLRRAAAGGKAVGLTVDPDWAPMRQRADFVRLLWDLADKGLPAGPP
jgi:serine/threonine-protein kinase